MDTQYGYCLCKGIPPPKQSYKVQETLHLIGSFPQILRVNLEKKQSMLETTIHCSHFCFPCFFVGPFIFTIISWWKSVWLWKVVLQTHCACQTQILTQKKRDKFKSITPWKINMDHKSWRFGRSFSFLNGRFVGSMLIFQGVWIIFQTFFFFGDMLVFWVYVLMFPRKNWQPWRSSGAKKAFGTSSPSIVS